MTKQSPVFQTKRKKAQTYPQNQWEYALLLMVNPKGRRATIRQAIPRVSLKKGYTQTPILILGVFHSSDSQTTAPKAALIARILHIKV